MPNNPVPPQNDASSSDSSSSSEDEEEIDQEEEEQDQVLPSPLTTDQFEKKKRDSNQAESDSEESDSESDPEPKPEKPDRAGNQRPAMAKPSQASKSVKPINSKSMDNSPQPKKAKPNSKAPAGSIGDEKDKEKKKRKAPESEDLQEIEHGDDHKKMFQRVWTEEDEIGLLNGFLDFMKKGGDPSSDKTAMVELVQKHLHAEFNRAQLFDKIRRLKKKYQTITNKGKSPNFRNPHEQNAYAISKKIWGGQVEDDGDGHDSESKGSKRSPRVQDHRTKDSKGSVAVDLKNQAKKRQRTMDSQKGDGRSENRDGELVENLENPAAGRDLGKSGTHPCLNGSLICGWDSVFGANCSELLGRNPVVPFETYMKKGLDLVDNSKIKQLEDRWQQLQLMEMEILIKRAELIKDQTQLVVEAIKARNS